MKKTIFLTSLFAMGILTFPSCTDFLTENDPNHIVAENYFSTENDVERAVNGAYMALRSGYCMGEGSTAYTEERSDNAGRWDNQSAAGEPFQFTDFSLLPSNTYLKSHWNAMFSTINNANFAIKGAEEVTFEDEAQRNEYLAEAKFVRALAYFDVVRKWGDAPLVTQYLSTPDEINAAAHRVDKSEIYTLIVEDLKFGVDKNALPGYMEAERGRANKEAAEGLLGKVYLTMAHVLDDGKRTEYLNNAKTYLEHCDAAKEFGSLSDISFDPEAANGVFNVDNKSTCPEILFQIVYRQGDKDYHSSIAKDTQPGGETTNSLYATQGVPMLKVTPDLVKEFETSENGYGWNDARYGYSVGHSTSQNCYYVTKFRDKSEAAGTLGYGGNDWIILRYADVELMLAEVNEALDNADAAIRYLDEVRARAGVPDYETAKNNPVYSSKFPTLKLAILHERRVELAFENQRWYDLLRFFTPSELVDYMHAKNQADYNESNLQNFSETDIYYPIPYDEWLLNPEGMYQNEGY